MSVSTVTVDGFELIVVDHTKRCGAPGCGVVLRLRRSLEQLRCCCHRGVCGPLGCMDEAECDKCGALLMVGDTHPTLCSDCAEEAS